MMKKNIKKLDHSIRFLAYKYAFTALTHLLLHIFKFYLKISTDFMLKCSEEANSFRQGLI